MTYRSATRREFIRNLGRTVAAGAIAGGGILLARESISRGCDETNPCGSCKMLERCDLPEAQAQRNE